MFWASSTVYLIPTGFRESSCFAFMRLDTGECQYNSDVNCSNEDFTKSIAIQCSQIQYRVNRGDTVRYDHVQVYGNLPSRSI